MNILQGNTMGIYHEKNNIWPTNILKLIILLPCDLEAFVGSKTLLIK